MWPRTQLALVARLGLQPRTVLKYGVLAGLGVYCVLIGVLAGRGSMLPTLALIALPLLLIAAVVVSRYFDSLVLILPTTALILPMLQLSTGTGSTIPFSLLLTLGLVGMWILSMLVRTRDIVPSPLNRPLLIFMTICVISLPWGIIWRDPILNMRIMGNFIVTQTASLFSLLASMSVPFLLGRFITKRWQITWFLGNFIVFGTLMTISQFLHINQSLLNDRGLWALWLVAPLMGVVFVQPKVRWWWRGLAAAALCLNLYQTMIVSSLWISGWLPSMIGAIAIVFLHSRKFFAILMLCMALVVVVGPGRGFLAKITQDNIDEGGLERISLWEQNWSVVSAHWLLGTGPAGYAAYYMTYFREDARSTHNNFLDILAQFGFVGMLAWIWVMGVSLWEGWRVVRDTEPGLLRTTAIVATGGWAAGLVSMMLGDWILPFAYNQGIAGYRYTVYSWIFLGLLVSVRQIHACERRAAEQG